MLLIDELRKYEKTFKDLGVFIEQELKLPSNVFYTKANNAVIIPQLINYIETKDISFIDALCYVNCNTNNSLKYNELVKKSIRTVFFMLEHDLPLDFIPF